MDRSSKPAKNRVKVTGNSYIPLTIATSTTAGYVNLTPGTIGSGRASNFANAFEFYRFTKLKVTMAPWVSNNNGQLAVGALCYNPEEHSTSTSNSLAAAMESPWFMPYAGSTVSSSTGTVQSVTQFLSRSIPRNVLLNTPLRAYVTNANSEDDFVQQGTLMAAVATASSVGATYVPLFLTWEIEFWGDIAHVLQLSQVIPAEKKQQPRPPPLDSSEWDSVTDPGDDVQPEMPSLDVTTQMTVAPLPPAKYIGARMGVGRSVTRK